MKSKYAIPMISLVNWATISYASFMRWKRRLSKGERPVKKPGPKPTTPLDLEALETDIKFLNHGSKRSCQTEVLHKKYRSGISRRDLNSLVRSAREHASRMQSFSKSQLKWRCPDLVWSIDGCEITSDFLKSKIHVQNIQDLHSTYKFNPLSTLKIPCGDMIAEHLALCFKTYGTPLFLKRDNAGNFNNRAVNDLLEEKMIIPLNSPPYYPPYNGGIEHAQSEIKAFVRNYKGKPGTANELFLVLDSGVHFLNHKTRRSLKGDNACKTYFTGKRLQYNKRMRKDVFDWIRDLAAEISIKMGVNKINPSAWRVACRKWMVMNDMIVIRKREKVLPNFSLKMCHY